MINNRQLVYVPIRLACGIRVYCSPEVLSTDPGVLRSLQADLTRIFRVLPRSVHCLIRRTNIWLNKSYMYGERADPQIMRHLTTHHEEGWLIHCAHDIPQKARGIEIYSCQDFQRMRLHWNGSGLLLHEYCHLIHQFCVEDGLDNDQVSALYRQAQASGRYERVLRRDWAGMDVDHDMAYAMVDRKEFFAEMSVTFLSNGYHTLDKADWNNMGSCTPPLLHPTVTDRVMRQHEHGIYSKQHSTGKVVDNTMVISHTGSRESSASSETGRAAPLSSSSSPSCWMPLVQALFPNHDTLNKKIRMVDHMFQEVAMSRNCINVPHCNKFYPFTRGQLQHYDKDLFRGIQALWKEIAMWDDPNGNNQSWCHSCSPWMNEQIMMPWQSLEKYAQYRRRRRRRHVSRFSFFGVWYDFFFFSLLYC